jgi:conjugative relaxase-like TrwC/TraI family protein
VVTAKTQYNLKNAQEYFEEHLCVGDYYNEGQRVAGEWMGLGAGRLGLSGHVRAEDFLRFCENQDPASGQTLTQRLNTTRTEAGQEAANRRIFYDFTFSPPKSVSIAAFIGKDDQIIEAHQRAVDAAVREFEVFAATRIRTGGAQNDRLTRNFAAALFTHETSRALDPHLHTHYCDWPRYQGVGVAADLQHPSQFAFHPTVNRDKWWTVRSANKTNLFFLGP